MTWVAILGAAVIMGAAIFGSGTVLRGGSTALHSKGDATAQSLIDGSRGSSGSLGRFGGPSGSGAAGSSTSPTAAATAAAAALAAAAGSNSSFNAAGAVSFTSGSVGLWAADWSGAAGGRSTAGWQAAAHNDQILIGTPGVYKKWIPQLRAWNPKLIILAYDLGPYLQKGSSNYNTILKQDPSWFAHDSGGRLINLPMFPGNYLMDMGNAGYRAWHASQVASTVASYGFSGVMDDSMGTGALGSYSSGTPVNPATHQPYSATQYLGNSVLMLNADKAALKGKYLAFNGLISGPQYSLDSHILATSTADAGISELFLRQPNSSVTSFPSTTEVQQSLQMMSDMSAHGKTFLGWTKMWSNGSAAQVAAWEQFAVGVYLLGRQGSACLDFMPSHQADNTVVSFSNLSTNLGAAVGTYQLVGSTFTRQFQNGSVSVNVATHATHI